jgi:peroxiredoxin
MHPRPSPLAIVGIAALAAFTIFITWRAKLLELKVLHHDEASELVNKPAPDFQLTTLDGSQVSLSDYRGKKLVVVSFWASWCGPCRLELPALRKFYERHHKDADYFEILAISIDEDSEDAQKFATKAKLPFPVLVDSSGKVANAYGANVIPMLFIVDKYGKVIYGHTGFDQLMEFQLTQKLGIKPNTPAEGATVGDASH